MKYYPCKNKTEFLTLLVMAEKNGFTIDSGMKKAREYADYYWGEYKCLCFDGDNAYAAQMSYSPSEDEKISFAQMAAILCNTTEPRITKKDLADYVCGWLEAKNAKSDNLTLNNIKAALHNAAFCLDCPNDGIEAYVKRRAAQS